ARINGTRLPDELQALTGTGPIPIGADELEGGPLYWGQVLGSDETWRARMEGVVGSVLLQQIDAAENAAGAAAVEADPPAAAEAEAEADAEGEASAESDESPGGDAGNASATADESPAVGSPSDAELPLASGED